jgi:ACT domain-containing protein
MKNKSQKSMKNKSQKVLKTLLHRCFGYYKYKESIIMFKTLLHNNPAYLEVWDDIQQLISERKMKVGEALNIIHNEANLPLDENSDEEAYKWLDLLITNVGVDTEQIVEY